MRLILAIAVVCLPLFPLFADEQYIDELRSSVADLSSTSSPTQPFSFRMQFPIHEKSSLQIDAGWLGNGDYTLLLSESESKIPVAVFVKEKFLFIDIVEGNVVTGTGVVPSLEFGADESKSESTLAFSFGLSNAADDRPAFDVRLRTLLAASPLDCRLNRREGNATLTWPSPSRRTQVEYEYKLRQTPVLTGMRVYAEGDDVNAISITNIEIGEFTEFTPFPDHQSLQMKTVEWQDKGSLSSALELYHQILRCASGIAALTDIECRELSIFSKEVDWDAVKRRVDELAPSLSTQLTKKTLGVKTK